MSTSTRASRILTSFADRNTYIRQRHPTFDTPLKQFGTAFVQWGGFYTPPPPPNPVGQDPSASEQVQHTVPEVPRRHMAAAVRSWTQKLGADAFVEKQRVRKPVVEIQDDVEPDVPFYEAAEVEVEVDAAPQEESLQASPESVLDALPLPPVEQAAPVQSAISKRRQKLLELARQNARTPLPPSAVPLTPEQREAKRKEAREEEDEMKKTVRERLWKLMGGKWM